MIVGAATTAHVKVTVLDVPAVASVAVAVTVAADRVTVGVPLILPELLMVRPVGSPVADQVTEPGATAGGELERVAAVDRGHLVRRRVGRERQRGIA